MINDLIVYVKSLILLFLLFFYIFFLLDNVIKKTIAINWIVSNKIYIKNRLNTKLFVPKGYFKSYSNILRSKNFGFL